MTRFEWLNKRGREILKESGALCNCGGPQYGTGHSPDCDWEYALFSAWDDAEAEWDDMHPDE